MISALIIDDEPKSRDTIKLLLGKYTDGIEVIGEAGDVESAIALINDADPELVFLDIEMPGGDGFNVLNSLDHVDFEVVFITAFDNFALKAFQLHACDYLMKPLDGRDLERAVSRVKTRIESKIKQNNIQKLLEQMEQQGSNNKHIKKLAVPTQEGMSFLEIKDIIYCESDGNYTYFYLKGGQKLLVTRTLKEYDESLTPYGFCRVHKSFLININEVEKYVQGRGGYVTMSNKEVINISARKKDDFLNMVRL